jgi:hypothetical protein
MAFQVSGCTVIDNDRNIVNTNNMCVGVVTMTGSSGDIETPGTITATAIDVPIVPISFSPTDGATGLVVAVNIVITFNQLVKKGTGNITLRNGSADGSIIQTIDVTAGTVTISGATVTINPPNDLPYSTEVFVVVDAGAFGNSFNSSNPIINTYKFTTKTVELGDPYEGGFLICQSSSVRWIVAPSSSEVSRNWYSRAHANTRAQQVSGCTGWFIPSCVQLKNPGYTCRTFWNAFTATRYWSATAANQNAAIAICFSNGSGNVRLNPQINCVRAFRCVTY